VHAFTVSFPDDSRSDEAPIARETARRLDVNYHECPVNAETALKWAVEGLNCMDQPSMDGLNTYMVSRAVREQGIIVALSGQGGDEVFGGYPSFRRVPGWYRQLKWLRPLALAWRASLAGLATAGKPSAFRAKARDIARTGSNLLGLYYHSRRLLSDKDLSALGLNASGLGLTGSFHCPKLESEPYLIPEDPIATVGRLESVFYLGNTLLRDGDVFGMANSLEIRVPFLDRDLLDWAFRLPGDTLLPNGSPAKFLLREMCAEFYTPTQMNQPKRGFSPPFSLWLLGPLREMMEESLGSVKSSGLLAPDGVDRIREVFLREPQSAAWSRVWGLVTLGYWLNEHKPTNACLHNCANVTGREASRVLL
jgi:asparagine synthase (glutamine-hydrolysing)